jgi:hypothetical protein
MVEYSLRSMSVPIGVSSWADEFTSQLPPELAVSLPSIDELDAELADRTDATDATDEAT